MPLSQSLINAYTITELFIAYFHKIMNLRVYEFFIAGHNAIVTKTNRCIKYLHNHSAIHSIVSQNHECTNLRIYEKTNFFVVGHNAIVTKTNRCRKWPKITELFIA